MQAPKLSLLLRRTHLYLALFLTPWMLVYALSSLVFNHHRAIRDLYGSAFNAFTKEKDVPYEKSLAAGMSPTNAADQILGDLGLAGPRIVQGNLKDRLTIMRQDPFVPRRITYYPMENRVVIEKQTFQTPNFLTRLHRRHGYEQPFPGARGWAVAVDLVVLAMLVWVISGVWMWWEIKPSRLWGAGFALVGFGLFALLLATL